MKILLQFIHSHVIPFLWAVMTISLGQLVDENQVTMIYDKIIQKGFINGSIKSSFSTFSSNIKKNI